MDSVCRGSSKKIVGDPRNNWMTFMFIPYTRYNSFRKQISIDTCIQAFHDLERFGCVFSATLNLP